MVYAIVLEWPKTNSLQLGIPMATQDTTITMLGLRVEFLWKPLSEKSGIMISIPPLYELPCQWAWVFRLENVK